MNMISLEQLAGGALQEKFNTAVRQVLENMQDPNTSFKNKRAVTVKLAFIQNEARTETTVEMSVDTRLAPVMPVRTEMAIGKDLKTGELYAEEYGKQIRGQMSLEDYQKQENPDPVAVIGEALVDTDTGEVIGNIADFRVKA